jgi:hypothetical protein
MERQIRRPETPADVPGLAGAARAMRIATLVIVVLAAATAWEARRRRAVQRRERTIAYAMPAALFALGALTCGATFRILHTGPAEQMIEDTLAWLRWSGYGHRPILSAHAYVEYRAGLTPPVNRPGLRGRLATAPRGAILVWDAQFAPSPHQFLSLDDIHRDPTLRPLRESDPLPGQAEPYLRVYEKAVEGPGAGPVPAPGTGARS